LCRSHILRLGGVSYLTNSDHKPDAPVLSTPRDTPILGAGGWWTNPKGVGSNGSYLVSWQTAYQVAVERDHRRLTTHPEVMDFSVEHGYRYLRILAGNEEPVWCANSNCLTRRLTCLLQKQARPGVNP
jgi:hypothetical protein